MALTSHKTNLMTSVNIDRKSCSLVIISAEGRRTERHYFKSLVPEQTSRIHVILTENENNESSPDRVLERLKEYLKQDMAYDKDLDYACIVVDVDQHAQLTNACKESVESGYEALVSNPCFELWLVLHHRDITTSRTTAADLMEMLDEIYHNAHRGTYNKTKFDFSVLKGGIQRAIDRAKELDTDHQCLIPDNPGTRVYRVVERILNDLRDPD